MLCVLLILCVPGKSSQINYSYYILFVLYYLYRHIHLFLANVSIHTPINHQNTFGFPVFSEGIKWEHWPEAD